MLLRLFSELFCRVVEFVYYLVLNLFVKIRMLIVSMVYSIWCCVVDFVSVVFVDM